VQLGGSRLPVVDELQGDVEFLIAEKLAEPAAGWKQAITTSRDDFHRRQLRAAIRRDLATATQAVKDFDTT